MSLADGRRVHNHRFVAPSGRDPWDDRRVSPSARVRAWVFGTDTVRHSGHTRARTTQNTG